MHARTRQGTAKLLRAGTALPLLLGRSNKEMVVEMLLIIQVPDQAA
jgi:hypothetical protein